MTARNTPRNSLRSSGRSSPASAKSSTATPSSSRPTRLRQSVTPATPQSKRSASAKGKTSPYFAKSSDKKSAPRGSSSRAARAAKRGQADDDDDDDDEEDEVEKAEYLSATGMTETSDESDSEAADESDDFDPSDGEAPPSEAVESDDEELDSDHLDSENEEDESAGKKGKKRKSAGGSVAGPSSKKGKASPTKGKHTVTVEGYDDEEFEELDIELEEGQEIAGRIYPAPKTGQVPPGRISQNTLNFLKNLQIPERNDRDWFRSHEPAFRQAENEWKAFVGMVQQEFHEADEEVPILPPRDIIHRIYRDVRFSSDKTPYKRSFSMTTSRGGRKGDWAAYHLSLSPNDKSILAAGVWMPGKNELASIRHRFLQDPSQFRSVIGSDEFVRLFGEARPHKKGERQNVFGHEDALKIAPKIGGVDKTHKDIDLLKLRSIAVVHKFSDEDVLQEDFRDKVKDVVTVMTPFVHLLNDYITIPENGADGDQDDEEAAGDNDEDD